MVHKLSKPRFVTSLARLGTVLSWLGCTPPAGECTASSAQALSGGSPDASSVGLDNVAASAVAAIVVESDSGHPSLCSGVLIAPRFVLTAGHCGPAAAPQALHISFSPSAAPFALRDPCAPPAATYPAVALERDPDADVMLVELASNVSPVPVVPIASLSPAIGQPAVIAGYGLTEQNTAGERLFVGTTVVGVGRVVAGDSGADAEADACAGDANAGACSGGALLITVDSGPEAGACAGDSGGPLFVRGALGWQVAGVLSEGSESCTGKDVYVDLASVTPWIRAHVGP
jgi:hypothetical protein